MSGYLASSANSTTTFQVKAYALDKVYNSSTTRFVPIGDAYITRVGKDHVAIIADGTEILKVRKCDLQFLNEAFKTYKNAVRTALNNIEIYKRSF
jgi:hypothetical protein